MENISKTREIIIEISRRPNVFNRTRNSALCFKCETAAELLTFSQAAEFCRTTLYDIYRRAENGEFHLLHNSKGEVRICQNSLQNHRLNLSEIIKVGESVCQTVN